MSISIYMPGIVSCTRFRGHPTDWVQAISTCFNKDKVEAALHFWYEMHMGIQESLKEV